MLSLFFQVFEASRRKAVSHTVNIPASPANPARTNKTNPPTSDVLLTHATHVPCPPSIHSWGNSSPESAEPLDALDRVPQALLRTSLLPTPGVKIARVQPKFSQTMTTKTDATIIPTRGVRYTHRRAVPAWWQNALSCKMRRRSPPSCQTCVRLLDTNPLRHQKRRPSAGEQLAVFAQS